MSKLNRYTNSAPRFKNVDISNTMKLQTDMLINVYNNCAYYKVTSNYKCKLGV